MTVRDMRRSMQMVFQDSYASLNPRLTIEETIAFGPQGPRRVRRAKRATGRGRCWRRSAWTRTCSPAAIRTSFPAASASASISPARWRCEPRLLILDEAVSALDKSVEAQVLNLLHDLKARLNLTYIFISHDLNVVRYISDRVLVMYLGKVVEIGPVEAIYGNPRHPYTRALLSSMPSDGPGRADDGRAADRRSAQPDQPAVRLPLPHPLPLRRGRLRRRWSPGCWPVVGAERHAAACHMRDPGFRPHQSHPAAACRSRRMTAALRQDAAPWQRRHRTAGQRRGPDASLSRAATARSPPSTASTSRWSAARC